MIMRARMNRDFLGIVAIDQRAAVEIEPEAPLPAVGGVVGELAVDVVGQARAIDLEPVHGQVFAIAQPAFLEIDGFEYPADIHRPGGGQKGEGGDENEEPSGKHGPITLLSADLVGDMRALHCLAGEAIGMLIYNLLEVLCPG